MERKKRVLIITAVALVLLFAAACAAFNAIFTVTDVSVNFFPVSKEGEMDSFSLQKELDSAFLNKSTAFLNLDEVKKIVLRYPAFELLEAKKEYPSRVTLSVAERREMFAVQKEDGRFAVLDEEGRYLYDKAENVNRTSGENILLEGFAVEYVAGEKTKDESFLSMLSFVKAFESEDGSPRSIIKSVRLSDTENALAGDSLLVIDTRGGVRIDIYEPKIKAEEKAIAAAEKYSSLEGTERLCGFFDVVELISEGHEGEISVSEHRKELPF